MVLGDTISDFAEQIGLDPSLLPSRRVSLNSGLTEAGLLAMLQANRLYARQPEKLHARRLEIIEFHGADQFTSANLLGIEARQTITALHVQGNLMVARRYLGLNENLFGEPELELSRHPRFRFSGDAGNRPRASVKPSTTRPRSSRGGQIALGMDFTLHFRRNRAMVLHEHGKPPAVDL